MHCQTLPGHNAKIREMYGSNHYNCTYSAVRVEEVSTDRYEKYQTLLQYFEDEKRLFSKLLSELPGAEARITAMISTISKWGYANASFEINQDGNAVFKIRLDSRRTVYIGVNLKEDDKNRDAYFAYYEYDRCERNGVGGFIDIVADLATAKIL